MGRPENPITADSPEALLALDLGDQRALAGNPKLRTMSERSGYSIAALSKAASGNSFPTWECTKAYLTGCEVTDPEVLEHFRHRWNSTQKAIKLRRSTEEIGGNDVRARGVSKVGLGSTLPTMGSVAGLGRLFPDNRSGTDNTLDLYVSTPGRYPLAELNGVTSSQELIAELNKLITISGYTVAGLLARISASNLPSIGNLNGPVISAATIRGVLAGRRRLTCGVVIRVVDACGGTSQEQAVWDAQCRRVHRIERRALAALEHVKDDLGLPRQTPARTRGRRTRGMHRASAQLRGLVVYLVGVLCIFGAGTLAIQLLGLAG